MFVPAAGVLYLDVYERQLLDEGRLPNGVDGVHDQLARTFITIGETQDYLVTPADRVEDLGYRYRFTGENIAWNQASPKARTRSGSIPHSSHRKPRADAFVPSRLPTST